MLTPEFIAGDDRHAGTGRRPCRRAGAGRLPRAGGRGSRPGRRCRTRAEHGTRAPPAGADRHPRPAPAGRGRDHRVLPGGGHHPGAHHRGPPRHRRRHRPGPGHHQAGEEVVDCRAAGHEAAFGTARVFARATPEQKLAIIAARQAAGDVVAMTGDGVNDGPALRRADIGVAMGRRGTEVARQAADLVLADDDLGTVVVAAEEGRRVYANIRRFLLYGLAGGSAEIVVMLAGPLVGLPLPLLPAQILWVNLLTHGLPGVALGSEPADPAAMRRPPRPPAESVLGAGLWQRIVRVGAGHRRRHPRRGAVGPRHRQAVADHGLLRAGHHPARGRPRLPRPPGHAGQPRAAVGRGGRARPSVRRDLPAVPQRPARRPGR